MLVAERSLTWEVCGSDQPREVLNIMFDMKPRGASLQRRRSRAPSRRRHQTCIPNPPCVALNQAVRSVALDATAEPQVLLTNDFLDTYTEAPVTDSARPDFPQELQDTLETKPCDSDSRSFCHVWYVAKSSLHVG